MEDKLLKILNRPYVRVVITLVAIFGSIVSYLSWQFPRNLNYKSLDIGLISNIEPVNINGAIKKDNIKIYYRDREIKNLVYLKFIIRNNGNLPIILNDFVEKVIIRFPDNTEIFDFNQSPENRLNMEKMDHSTISLTSNLLNPGDSVTIEMVTETKGSSISVSDITLSGRIIGASDIRLRQHDEEDFQSEIDRKIDARKKLVDFGRSVIYSVPLLILLFLAMAFTGYNGTNEMLKLLSRLILYMWNIFIVLTFVATIVLIFWKVISIIISAI